MLDVWIVFVLDYNQSSKLLYKIIKLKFQIIKIKKYLNIFFHKIFKSIFLECLIFLLTNCDPFP